MRNSLRHKREEHREWASTTVEQKQDGSSSLGERSGIGLALAKGSRAAGANVSAHKAAGEKPWLKLPLIESASLGKRSFVKISDVTDAKSLENHQGRSSKGVRSIDILVNSAGARANSFTRSKRQGVARHLETNLNGTSSRLASLRTAQMSVDTGRHHEYLRLFPLSSLYYEVAAYSASKAAACTPPTKSLAIEWAAMVFAKCQSRRASPH